MVRSREWGCGTLAAQSDLAHGSVLAHLQRVGLPLRVFQARTPSIKSLLILFSGLATCLGPLQLLSRDSSNVGLQSIPPISSQPRLKRPLAHTLGGLVHHQVRALPFTSSLGFSPRAAQGQCGPKGKACPNYCKLESSRELLKIPLSRSHPTDQNIWKWEPGISIFLKFPMSSKVWELLACSHQG